MVETPPLRVHKRVHMQHRLYPKSCQSPGIACAFVSHFLSPSIHLLRVYPTFVRFTIQAGTTGGKGAGFTLKDVSEAKVRKYDKGSTRLNPYRSVSLVVCGGTRPGRTTRCNKKARQFDSFRKRGESRESG